MDLLGLLAVPLIVAAFAALCFRVTITLKEVLVQYVGVSLLMVAGFFIARHYGMSDVEHLHGRVTGKDHGNQKCCHCHTVCSSRDTKGNCKSRREVCTHTRDFWWALDTTVGRVSVADCSSSNSTPRIWARARVGEPATVTNSYTNYLKADPESLFVHAVNSRYLPLVPGYPALYDLYKVDPVISSGPPIPEGWQDAFRELNADLGPAEQVDVTVLLTGVQDPTFAQAVESKWLYGPKNSMTLILGVQGDLVTWARVVSFSRIEVLKIELRDGLVGKSLGDGEIPGIVREAVRQKFRRTPMAEFEYLASSARPPTGWLVALYFLGVLATALSSVYLHRTDVFGDERPFRSVNPFSRRYFR